MKKGKKSQLRFSRGTSVEVHDRLIKAGYSLTKQAVYKRLLRSSHLLTLKLAAEVEEEKEIERKELASTEKRIERTVK